MTACLNPSGVRSFDGARREDLCDEAGGDEYIGDEGVALFVTADHGGR